MKSEYKITDEQHLYTSDEKIKWLGYGEWVEEPDSVNIEYLGYEAAVQRIFVREPYATEEAYFGGHLCGYVRIPDTHPYFKKEDIDLDCHGGITFSEAHEQHWVGFDCGHSCDLVPSTERFKKLRVESGELELFPIPPEFMKYSLFNPVYRNIQYCIDSCIEMIDHLVRVSVTDTIKKSDG